MCTGRLPLTILFRSTSFRAMGVLDTMAGAESGVPALRDVLHLRSCRTSSERPERLPAARSESQAWTGARALHILRVVGRKRVDHLPPSPVLPSSNLQFTEGRHSRKSTVRGATNPRFTVDRLPTTSTIHEWHTSNTSTFHGRQTSNKPTVHGGQTSKSYDAWWADIRLMLCASPR